MISIQKAQIHHFPMIAALNVEAYREYANQLTAETWAALQARLSAVETVAEFAEFWIVVIDGNLAGSVAYGPPGKSVAPIPAEWASILLLAVSPDYRRQGIARALMEACVQQATEDGAPAIGLFTSELMTGAHQLYQSLGFDADGEIPLRPELKFWRYKLDLTAAYKTAPLKPRH